MIQLSDEDIEVLINRHYGRSTDKSPLYSLRELIELGCMYVYGDAHFKNGKVVPCLDAFSLYAPHKCSGPAVGSPSVVGSSSRVVEVRGIHPLGEAPSLLCASWAGYNLALVTGTGEFQAYFKREFLFSRVFPGCCVIQATASRIYAGLHSGTVVLFDPVMQASEEEARHSNTVTSLSVHKGTLLSSSMDGSIFYKRRMQVANCGILDVKYVSDNKFVCACADNTIAVFEDEAPTFYQGHTSMIKALTNGAVCVSSSQDGQYGLLLTERSASGAVHHSLEMYDVGCSLHKQFKATKVLGYGLDEISVFDLGTAQKTYKQNDSAFALDIIGNTFAYATDTIITIKDFRSPDKCQINMRRNIVSLSYSGTGDMLLAATTETPFILDLRYI